MGFPVNQKYAMLTFYYKTNLTGSSTFNAYVDISDATGNVIGFGVMIFNGVVPAYTLASIPIQYTAGAPATAVIAF